VLGGRSLFGGRAPRFSLKQEGSRFFEKKRRKKRLFAWACGAETSTAQFKKVFCFFLFTKRSLPLRLNMTRPKPIMLQQKFFAPLLIDKAAAFPIRKACLEPVFQGR
jgi:hypothetical protein